MKDLAQPAQSLNDVVGKSPVRTWGFWIKSTSDGKAFYWRGIGPHLAHAWPILAPTEFVVSWEEL